MFEDLQQLQGEALAALASASDAPALEAWRVRFLGRKGGALGEAMKRLGALPREERPAYGQAANQVKEALEAAFGEREGALQAAALANELAAGAVDVTLPGRRPEFGHLHLTTQTLRQIYAIFAEMGFQVFEAPEVEWDEFNFGLLNMPPYHPARDKWDTFWVDDRIVMRTHTSPGQIRAMREFYPEPIRVILPGKCYRFEQVSVRSEFQFYQMEGLAVGKNIALTDLIGTLHQFAKKMYGAAGRLRVRSSYFPFTEPSIEADMNCILCGGKGCPVCKYTGWLEVGGAGMVHPQVLRNGGYDPDVYSGFAFGLGVERPALLKYRINDIRYFYGNDLRFSHQF
ncbi:MAG TPA: phenylalanine--tRNA ligase subunit alpha [Anaerolineae bacterium]